MKVKIVLLIVSVLLSGGLLFSPILTLLIEKLTIKNYAVAQDTDTINGSSESSIEQEAPYFKPIAREEDEKYRGRAIGVGTFAECPPRKFPPPTAFVPGKGIISFRSMTAKSNPKIWFYIPDTSDPNLSTKFSNLSTEFDVITDTLEPDLRPLRARVTFPGVFPIEITQPLNYERDELWSFKIICDNDDRDSDIPLFGYIERRNISYPKNESTPEEKYIYYAEEGLWHETLTTLIEDLCPQNPQRAERLIIKELSSEYIGRERDAQHYARALIEYCHP